MTVLEDTQDSKSEEIGISSVRVKTPYHQLPGRSVLNEKDQPENRQWLKQIACAAAALKELRDLPDDDSIATNDDMLPVLSSMSQTSNGEMSQSTAPSARFLESHGKHRLDMHSITLKESTRRGFAQPGQKRKLIFRRLSSPRGRNLEDDIEFGLMSLAPSG